jgi:hypothetical protein
VHLLYKAKRCSYEAPHKAVSSVLGPDILFQLSVFRRLKSVLTVYLSFVPYSVAGDFIAHVVRFDYD